MGSNPRSGLSLAQVFAGWDAFQRELVEMVAPRTPAELAQRVAPNQRPAGVIAAHIVASRVYWFHGVLSEGEADVASLMRIDHSDTDPLEAAALEMALERSWHLISAALDRWTVADLGAPVNFSGQHVTRQWIIWHVIQHDLVHAGELLLTLGSHGVRVPDL